MTRYYKADVIIAGGGLAGIVTALELIGRGRSVLLFEKDETNKFGGQAKESFGGVHLIGTPHQKRIHIQDTPDLAFRDWERFADFKADDIWPRRWARLYCDRSHDLIFRFLDDLGVKFLPVVNWAERGLFQTGNSVPRWHIAWGTGREIVKQVISGLNSHRSREKLQIRFSHDVSGLLTQGNRISGLQGTDLTTGDSFEAEGECTVIASGGICGGDLSAVREHWNKKWRSPPKHLLNGSHRFADGKLHRTVQNFGGHLTSMEHQWHYPAGIHHPAKKRPFDGLSLVPPRSALWLNAHGERIGPVPLMGCTDTRHLVETVLQQPGQYSWLLLNWKIACRELAVSGSEFMTAFRDKNRVRLLKDLLIGDHELVRQLSRECPEDFLVAPNLLELVEKMNAQSLEGESVRFEAVEKAVREYDDEISRGPAFFTDEQLRRIMSFRTYRGDRMRLCQFQRIQDQRALPLIAIRCFILSRKSLGGIQTDLQCRVLRPDGSAIEGLYAVGEAAGFGGGGIHGKRSLEGTFLGSCVLTGRVAAQSIGGHP